MTKHKIYQFIDSLACLLLPLIISILFWACLIKGFFFILEDDIRRVGYDRIAIQQAKDFVPNIPPLKVVELYGYRVGHNNASYYDVYIVVLEFSNGNRIKAARNGKLPVVGDYWKLVARDRLYKENIKYDLGYRVYKRKEI